MSVWFWERVQSAFQAAAVVNDLLKAFHCINHELLIAKVNDYGLNNSSLSFIFSYPSEKIKELNSSFSSSTEILFGVSQVSILAPMVFNTYVCDLVSKERDFEYASFADETTPYTGLPEMILISEKLEKFIQNMLYLFSENLLKVNTDKFHLISRSKVPVDIEISNLKKIKF